MVGTAGKNVTPSLRINESVRGSYTFFIQSTCQPHDNLVELLLWIDTAKRASAGYITA